jgi:serine/threonine-protein kinase HipA
MSVAGKRDNFTIEDLRACAQTASLKRGTAERTLAEVSSAVADWPTFAEEVGVDPDQIDAIARTHRLGLLPAPL